MSLISEIIVMFFVMLAVSAACILGVEGGGAIAKAMPKSVPYLQLAWMVVKTKAVQAFEYAKGVYNRITGTVKQGVDATKRGLATVIPFRKNNDNLDFNNAEPALN